MITIFTDISPGTTFQIPKQILAALWYEQQIKLYATMSVKKLLALFKASWVCVQTTYMLQFPAVHDIDWQLL